MLQNGSLRDRGSRGETEFGMTVRRSYSDTYTASNSKLIRYDGAIASSS